MISKTAIIAIIAAVVVVGGGATAAVILMNNNNDEFVIASSPDFVPYDYQVGDKWAGIDMDVCKAVCDEIGWKYRFESVQFDSIIPGIEGGKYDMGASGFSITEDRKKNVLFTDSYAQVTNVAVVPVSSSLVTYDDVKNAKCGAQNGTTGHLIAEEAGFPRLTTYNTYSDVFQELRLNHIDCIILDSDTARSFVNDPDNTGQFKILQGVAIGEIEYYAFVFALDDAEHRDKFNEGLKTIKENGLLDKIIDYYAAHNYSKDTPSYFDD